MPFLFTIVGGGSSGLVREAFSKNLFKGYFVGRDKVKVRKIPWVSWKTLCKPKAHRGLGIRDVDVFNESLLAK